LEKSENKNKEKPYQEVQKKLRFDGVELPRIRNSEGTKEQGPKRPNESRREDPDSEDNEEVRETTPRPPTPPKPASSQINNRLLIWELNPRHLDNEMSKDNGPKGAKFHLQSEVYKPGIEEAVAAKIMDSKVKLTSEELAALSPGVCRIIARKMQNRRVKPRERLSSSFVKTTVLDMSGDVRNIQVLSCCINVNDLSLPKEDTF
jgi:hypothetical protein